jgi:hypothetical protein
MCGSSVISAIPHAGKGPFHGITSGQALLPKSVGFGATRIERYPPNLHNKTFDG